MNSAPRILAVDDQPAHLALLKRVLAPAGFEVLEARSGSEALAVAKESGPDLILLDMHLPDMHGLEVLKRLRASPWGATLRIVAMSALASPEDQRLWREAGCVGVVEKPITFSTFVEEISRWLPGAPQGEQPVAPPAPRSDKLGEILVANELITPEQLEQALAIQGESGKRLGQVLVQQGAVSEDDIAWALSNQLGYPYVFLTPDSIDEEAAHLLPVGFLRERYVLPLLKFGQEMTLAMADPTDQRTVDEVVERTGLQVKRALALASNIETMLDRLFRLRATPTARQAAEVHYAHFHLLQALQQEATEIHFDPGVDGQARVRYRTQGVLVDRPAQAEELHAAILQWLRDLVGLDDQPVGSGAASAAIGDVDLHLDVAFLPTATGPAATVALYPRRGQVPEITQIITGARLGSLLQVLPRGRGVLLVGCADGEVRSTILHALIPPLPGRKVWALERLPIYRRATVQQTPVGSAEEVGGYIRTAARAGADLVVADDLSHPAALTAALETGRSRLVLGGHPQDDVAGLVAQVLDASGAALVASTLVGVLVARPIRLLCAACKQPAPTLARGFDPRGCEMCGFTGFRGQRVLSDVWLPGGNFRMLFQTGRVTAALEEVIQTTGAQMREQGLALVTEGLTSAEELARVIEMASWTSPTSSS